MNVKAFLAFWQRPTLPYATREDNMRMDKGRVMFPWHVSRRERCGKPLIADANGKVVAQIMAGGMDAAACIVISCNRHAAMRGLVEL